VNSFGDGLFSLHFRPPIQGIEGGKNIEKLTLTGEIGRFPTESQFLGAAEKPPGFAHRSAHSDDSPGQPNPWGTAAANPGCHRDEISQPYILTPEYIPLPLRSIFLNSDNARGKILRGEHIQPGIRIGGKSTT